jgi:hypothetical protein
MQVGRDRSGRFGETSCAFSNYAKCRSYSESAPTRIAALIFSGEFIHEHLSYERDESEHAGFLCAALGSASDYSHSAALPGLSASW